MWKNEPKNGSRTNMKKVAGNNAASVRLQDSTRNTLG